MIRFVAASLPVACMFLAGCGPSDNDPAPGGVTVSEAKALDEAAEMIEQRRLPEDAIAPTGEPSAAPGDAEPAAQPQ